MKAPKSWILEYVDVPEGTTTDELTARLTLTGLKLEAIESAGAAISGPRVVGLPGVARCTPVQPAELRPVARTAVATHGRRRYREPRNIASSGASRTL